MLESRAKIATELVHMFPGEAFHERAKRELVNLASPILNPTELQAFAGAVGDGDLRDESRIIAGRREDDLINAALISRNSAKVPDTENAIKRFCVARIEGAQDELPVSQISESACELSAFGRVVVQEFGSAFILAYTNVSVVGRNRYNAIVPDLMNVLG